MDNNKPYTPLKISCSHCQTPQVIHMLHTLGGSSQPLETVTCIDAECLWTFDMPVPCRIIRGPFPVG